MGAVFDSANSAHVGPASGEAARTSARAATIALAAVLIAFGAAFAVGSVSKKTSTHPSTGQLAPVSALQGQASVKVAVPSAAGSIPALAQAVKPNKPAHHARAAQTQAAASTQSSSPTQSASVQSTQVQSTPVQQQPVQQQPVQQPVHHSSPPPVVVVHGG